MAQKIFICEGMLGTDLLQSQPLAAAIAGGYEVAQVSGFCMRDNRPMVAVLMSEPAAQQETQTQEQQSGGTTETQTETTEQQGEGGGGGE